MKKRSICGLTFSCMLFSLALIAGCGNPGNNIVGSAACSHSGGCWSATSITGAPSARYYQTGVWTGTEMIVWGGYISGYMNTGGRYNPSTDSWTATDTSDPDTPVARNEHSAVWTDNEMIIFGGRGLAGALNSGGKYDPSTNSWTATSVPADPSIRRMHSTIWTGSQMIVWGGYDDSNYLNTGNIYTPGTDSWTATTTTDAPSGRRGHSAIWTGTEMIVWGGYSYDTEGHLVNDGGKYDPVANTWAAVDNADPDTPSARYLHSAVWTGTEMIVWGGNTFSSELGDGARYDPALSSNAWVPVSTTNAPPASGQHSAVWTGDRMIIWGGAAFNPINTGGIYDPTTDIWIDTSMTNVPTYRVNHCTVWTGKKMMVWGGQSDFSVPATLLDSGGILRLP